MTYTFYGVNRVEECSLDTLVTQITIVLEDEESRSEEFNTFVVFYENALFLLGAMALSNFNIEISDDFVMFNWK